MWWINRNLTPAKFRFFLLIFHDIYDYHANDNGIIANLTLYVNGYAHINDGKSLE